MKEDINFPKVENVAIVIAQETNEYGESSYNTYLMNLRKEIMEGIIVTSKGYGKNEKTGETEKTSTLRHTIEVLLPGEVAKIEPIVPEVFHLANEYHLSFWSEEILYDKKYIFVPDSIREENLVFVDKLGTKGVMII